MRILKLAPVVCLLFLYGCILSPTVSELHENQVRIEAKLEALDKKLEEYNDAMSADMDEIKAEQEKLSSEMEMLEKNYSHLRKKVSKRNAINPKTNGSDLTQNGGNETGNDLYAKAKQSFNQGKYEDAILNYQKFIDQNPGDKRVADSYLVQAESLIRLDRKKEATFFLNTLIDKHPNSNAATIAKKKLEAMK